MKNVKNFSADSVQTAGAVETEVTVTTSAVDFAQIAAAAANLKEKKEQKAVVITPLYFPFKTIGQKTRGIYIGIREIEVTDKNASMASGGEQVLKSIPAVVWMDEDQKTWLQSGVSLVRDVVKSGILPGTEIEITYVDDKSVATGTVKLFTLGVL